MWCNQITWGKEILKWMTIKANINEFKLLKWMGNVNIILIMKIFTLIKYYFNNGIIKSGDIFYKMKMIKFVHQVLLCHISPPLELTWNESLTVQWSTIRIEEGKIWLRKYSSMEGMQKGNKLSAFVVPYILKLKNLWPKGSIYIISMWTE